MRGIESSRTGKRGSVGNAGFKCRADWLLQAVYIGYRERYLVGFLVLTAFGKDIGHDTSRSIFLDSVTGVEIPGIMEGRGSPFRISDKRRGLLGEEDLIFNRGYRNIGFVGDDADFADEELLVAVSKK